MSVFMIKYDEFEGVGLAVIRDGLKMLHIDVYLLHHVSAPLCGDVLVDTGSTVKPQPEAFGEPCIRIIRNARHALVRVRSMWDDSVSPGYYFRGRHQNMILPYALGQSDMFTSGRQPSSEMIPTPKRPV